MGRWAAETLVGLVEAGDTPAPPFPHLMPCPLVRRDSVARPA
jgi:DNA-binding LacI/PurR family transcriptional regulator